MIKLYSLQLLYVVAIYFMLINDALSQSDLKELSDSTGLNAYILVRGQTSKILYDSSFVLNKRLFHLLMNNYNEIRSGSRVRATEKMIIQYENIISLQDSMIKTRDGFYDDLKSKFDNLSTQAGNFVNNTDQSLLKIDKYVTNAAGLTADIKSLLDSSIKQLKIQKRQKLKLFFSGFAVAAGTATLVAIAIK